MHAVGPRIAAAQVRGMALRRHGGRPLHTTTTAAVAAAGAALSCPSPSLLLPLPLSTKAGAARDASATTSALYTRTFVHGGRRLFHSTPVSQQQQQQQQQRDGIPAAAAGTLLDIPLASLGSGVRQALVGHWRVQPGDLVRRGEVMVELSSATADFGLQAPCDARVVELHVEEGEMAIVGAPIIRLMLVEDARAAMPATSAATSSYAASSSAATSAAVGAGASGRASMTASSGGQMDPVDAAAHVLRLQRLLKRARRERRPADQIYALLVAIMRTNNEQGWFARTRAFYDTEVEQSEAHGEPMSKEYWRAEDALQAQRGTPAAMQQQQQQQQQLQQQQQVQQQPPPTPAPAPETASSKLIFTPPASSVYASDNSSSYAPSSPALYVRRVLPSYPHMYVPIFSVRRLFAREDASKQSYYVWLMVLTGVVAFLYHDSEFLDIHLKNATGYMKDMNAKLAKTFAPAPVPSTRFMDVLGCDEAKHEMSEIVEYLRNPDKFTKLGGKMPKGILLLGPPGTGKTLLARAVAGEANVPFFAVSGSDFEEMYQGLGAQRVRTLFSAARKLKKAIIFIDEIDTIGGKRSVQLLDVADHDRSVLNQLLSEMDGYVSIPGVIVIAATNYAETLDPALLRPGRFDRHVVVGLPDIKGRREILEYYGRKLKLDPKVNLGVLARGTAGMTGADLSQLLNAAALRASANNQSLVTLADLEHAKDTVMMGVARTSGVLTPEMRRHLAYYHAGRSLVSLHTSHSLPVHKVTIMQRGEHLGAVALQQDSDDDRTSSSYAEMLAQLDLHLGGRAAEELVYGVDEVTSHGTGDLSRAAALARTMVMEYGFGARHGPVSDNAEDPSFAERASDATKRSVDAEVRALLQASHARARALLARHQEELHRVAEALIKHETLDGRELKMVAEGKEIDKPVVEARTFADDDAAPAPEPEASAAPA